MGALSYLAVGLATVAVSQGVPTDATPSTVMERGPMNFTMGIDHPLSKRFGNFSVRAIDPRSDSNYIQDYKVGGTVNFTPGTNTFSLNWNTEEDFVVGVGWQPGSTTPITHSGTFSVESGLGSMGVYGWSTNPLVEYYIMETNVGISTGGTQMGTVTSDGAEYAIWEHQQVNQPSIQGTSTFEQFISIRQTATSSGTITLENHFKAWAALGMNLGTLNYQVIAVESWQGSGTAQQTISNTGTASTGSGSTTTTGSSGTGSTGSAGSGTCAAMYGQCGGTGWTGATCCSAGTCKESNSYYSQCS
ncbi:glycoside hydrolase family 11 protein [Xylariaceae sp. FL0804]|nr:glycoside hydrolase family 11 protein [Xylariaceae sp. FL0804]